MAHLLKLFFWSPAQFGFGFVWATLRGFYFGRTEVTRVNFYDSLAEFESDHFTAPVSLGYSHSIHGLLQQAQGKTLFLSAPLDELPHAWLHTGNTSEVLWLLLLRHHPLHTDIILSMPPIAKHN